VVPSARREPATSRSDTRSAPRHRRPSGHESRNVTRRSPGAPPRTPAPPAPRTRTVCPSVAAPAGSSTRPSRRPAISPAPSHRRHGRVRMPPAPAHAGQAPARGLRRLRGSSHGAQPGATGNGLRSRNWGAAPPTRSVSPAPPHDRHTTTSAGTPPSPAQSGQVRGASTATRRGPPRAAVDRHTVRSTQTSSPRRDGGRRVEMGAAEGG